MTELTKITSLKVIDLFAGGGGLSKGFQNAGYNIVAAFDNWEPAADLYKENFKSHPMYTVDVASDEALRKIVAMKPDIIIGGPPCQDFSSAGKRDESNGRADLTVSYSKIIQKVKPKYFLMENVERARKSNAFAIARENFESAGYFLTAMVLDASLCGVPQKRKRFFVFGELYGATNHLLPYVIQNQSNKPMTLRDYFGDKLGFENYYRHPRSYKRRAVFSIDEPSPTVRGVNRPVPSGYPGHKGDTSTIDGSIRPLTTRERSMVQTFPEDYILKGTKTNLEQIIGNAVPVKLAEFVANGIKSVIETENTISYPLPEIEPSGQLILFDQKPIYGKEELQKVLVWDDHVATAIPSNGKNSVETLGVDRAGRW